MIFLTVGTFKYDALVAELDRLAGSGRLDEPVIAQIGHGDYEPRHCEWFRLKPSIQSYVLEASLVISHGGTTMHQVLQAGKRLIAVPNPTLAGDHQTRHVLRLAAQGYLLSCTDLRQLEALIRSDRVLRPYEVTVARLVERVRRFIDEDRDP